MRLCLEIRGSSGVLNSCMLSQGTIRVIFLLPGSSFLIKECVDIDFRIPSISLMVKSAAIDTLPLTGYKRSHQPIIDCNSSVTRNSLSPLNSL